MGFTTNIRNCGLPVNLIQKRAKRGCPDGERETASGPGDVVTPVIAEGWREEDAWWNPAARLVPGRVGQAGGLRTTMTPLAVRAGASPPFPTASSYEDMEADGEGLPGWGGRVLGATAQRGRPPGGPCGYRCLPKWWRASAEGRAPVGRNAPCSS